MTMRIPLPKFFCWYLKVDNPTKLRLTGRFHVATFQEEQAEEARATVAAGMSPGRKSAAERRRDHAAAKSPNRYPGQRPGSAAQRGLASVKVRCGPRDLSHFFA